MEIHRPLTLHEIYQALGLDPTANCDLGYACANTHGKTNKWARYKPVRLYTKEPITEAMRVSASFGTPRNASIGETTGPLGEAWRTTDAYPYNPPIEGTHWFRISDWADSDNGEHLGYDSSAKCPTFEDMSDIYFDSLHLTYSVPFTRSGWEVKSTWLDYGDYPDLANLYPCVIIYYDDTVNGGRNYIFYTAQNTFGSGGKTVRLYWSDISGIVSGKNPTYYRCASDKRRAKINGVLDSTPADTMFCQLPRTFHPLTDGAITYEQGDNKITWDPIGVSPGVEITATEHGRTFQPARYYNSAATAQGVALNNQRRYLALLDAACANKSGMFLFRVNNYSDDSVKLVLRTDNKNGIYLQYDKNVNGSYGTAYATPLAMYYPSLSVNDEFRHDEDITMQITPTSSITIAAKTYRDIIIALPYANFLQDFVEDPKEPDRATGKEFSAEFNLQLRVYLSTDDNLSGQTTTVLSGQETTKDGMQGINVAYRESGNNAGYITC